MTKRLLKKFVVIRFQPTESDTISLPGFQSDFVGWSDLIGSDKILYRICWPGESKGGDTFGH